MKLKPLFDEFTTFLGNDEIVLDWQLPLNFRVCCWIELPLQYSSVLRMELHHNFWVLSETIKDVLRRVTADVNQPIEVGYRHIGRVQINSSVGLNQG